MADLADQSKADRLAEYRNYSPLQKLVVNPLFDGLVLGVIFTNCIFLALQTPSRVSCPFIIRDPMLYVTSYQVLHDLTYMGLYYTLYHLII